MYCLWMYIYVDKVVWEYQIIDPEQTHRSRALKKHFKIQNDKISSYFNQSHSQTEIDISTLNPGNFI